MKQAFRARPRRRKRRLLTYKNIFIGLLIIVASVMWYKVADDIDNNNKILKEETEYGR